MPSPMYITRDQLPPPLTRDEILAGLRRLALDAGDEAARAIGGEFAVRRKADSRLLMAAHKLLSEQTAADA